MAVKFVMFYPTYGYRDHAADWVIPLRIWVHEKSDVLRRLAARGARKIIRRRAGLERLHSAEKRIFMSRAEDFVADSKSNETVVLAFDRDPDREPFRLQTAEGKRKTDRNGLIEGCLTLPRDKAQNLLAAQDSEQGWLTYRAVSKKHQGMGRVRLIEPSGVSVISDIDDTIKITDITSGEPAVLRHTFFRTFVAVPGMVERYQAFDREVAFHYISGSPWQLYKPLSQFLFGTATPFPLGSFHMKNVRTNPFESESYQDLWQLLVYGSQQTTIEQKTQQISTLMTHFPARKFILIGDSGERDPEVFRAIQARFPDQIDDIWIRDVVNDRERNASRLHGMRVLLP